MSVPSDQLPAPGSGSQAAQGSLWAASQVQPTWGVYDSNGGLAIIPDSMLAFSLERDSDLPTFPVQAGSGTTPSGFANYNKVSLPYDVVVKVSKGGTQDDRSQLLQDIETMYASLGAYTIITPEESYTNVNLKNYRIERNGPSGAFFLQEVYLYFRQIEQVSAQYTSTSSGTNLQNAQPTAAQPADNLGYIYPTATDLPTQMAGDTAIGTLQDLVSPFPGLVP